MGLSSRRVAGVCLGALMLAPSAGAPVAAAPATVAVHPGLATGLARPALPRFQRFGTGPGARAVARPFRRFGRGDGYLGAAGAGLATAGLAEEAYGAPPPVAYAPPEPPPLPSQPACPMIIKVGPGLEHPVQTRVIYGAPACY